MGVVYSTAAVLLGGWFVWRALRLWRGTSPAESMRLFRFSIVYLALLFAAVAADARSWPSRISRHAPPLRPSRHQRRRPDISPVVLSPSWCRVVPATGC
jgi:hypothetical protein